MTADVSGLTAWLEANLLLLIVVAVVAALVYRFAQPLVHRAVARTIRPVAIEGVDPAAAADEAAKRALTIEAVLTGALRLTVLVIVVLVILTIFNLLPLLAGLAVVLAALTLAGQPIVLDYLMGLLILIEGQYYKGDWIATGTGTAAGTVEGIVEDVGIRRTVVRDGSGTVHSISNGTIRVSSNLTRVFANLQVDVTIADPRQVDAAIAVIDEVGEAMAADPAWTDALLETPRCTRVLPLTEAGVGLRAAARIRASDRWTAPSEFRRRLVTAFDTAGIELPLTARASAAATPGAQASPPSGTTPPAPPPPAASPTSGPSASSSGSAATPPPPDGRPTDG